VLQKNVEKRITKFAFCGNDYNSYYGYGLAKIPLDSDDKLYQEYEPVKLEYVSRILERSTKKYSIWEKAEELHNNPKIKHARGKKDLAVLAQTMWPTLTTSEISSIISASSMLMRSGNIQ
jgi:hypothetical protein